MRTIESILSPIDPREQGRLRPLMADGPVLWEQLTGLRPHRAMLWRHHRKGVHGVRLQAVSAGRTLLTSARWIAEHLVDVAEARQGDAATEAAPARRPRRRKPRGRRLVP